MVDIAGEITKDDFNVWYKFYEALDGW
jgi:hypothetical protein